MRWGTTRRIAVICLWIGGVLVASTLALALGLVTASNIIPAVVAAGSVAAVGAVMSERLLSRTRFRVGKLPEDPGHYDTTNPLLFLTPADLVRGRIAVRTFDDGPGTYPKGGGSRPGQRLLYLWNHPINQVRQFRTIQYKFATLVVEPRWNDALECEAQAEVIVRNGDGSGLPIGVPKPTGQLNWLSDSVVTRVLPTYTELAAGIVERLNALYDVPAMGINTVFQNPRCTIHEGNLMFLPLFYVREREPTVYLCGGAPGLNAGAPSGGEPLHLEFKVVVSSIKCHRRTVIIDATAEWDDLRMTITDSY